MRKYSPIVRVVWKFIVAQKLRVLRIEKGLTQNEVSMLTGINPVTLSGYETGKNEPNLEALVRLASLYEVSLDYLVYFEGE